MNGLDRRERRRRYQRQERLKEYGIIAGLALGILLVLGGVSLLGVKLFGKFFASQSQLNDPVTKNESNQPVKPVSSEEQPLQADGVIVMIDPGHGQRVPGCVVGDIMEKDIILQVSLKLRDALKETGATVIMTRENDTDYPRLKERGKMANKAKADYFISIHCNAYSEDTSIRGFESYYYDTKSQDFSDNMVEAAKNQGIPIQDSKYGNFQVLRDAKMKAVLLEIGYMSNEAELKDMCSEDYQNRLVKAITKGFLKQQNTDKK